MSTQAVKPGAGQVGAPSLSVGGPTTTSWREHVLARAEELRFLKLWIASRLPADDPVAAGAFESIDLHLAAAKEAAEGIGLKRRVKRMLSLMGGSMVERAMSNLDAAESDLLRLAPTSYLLGQLDHFAAHARLHLPAGDARLVGVERLVARRPTSLTDVERDALIAAVHVASGESRREVTRVRSFRNVLLMTAAVLSIVAIGTVVLGVLRPSVVPLCFAPDQKEAVCPTSVGPVAAASGDAPVSEQEIDAAVRKTAGPWDIPVVELAGLLAAAVAAAASLREIKGSSTPYSLPISLAVLKLPTGALTALLGILLMRGQFVPGLTALDTPAQIVAWAIVFGYAQQLLTRFVDRQAQTVLDQVGSGGDPAAAQQRALLAPTSTAPLQS
jgi:hypothetical protein